MPRVFACVPRLSCRVAARRFRDDLAGSAGRNLVGPAVLLPLLLGQRDELLTRSAELLFQAIRQLALLIKGINALGAPLEAGREVFTARGEVPPADGGGGQGRVIARYLDNRGLEPSPPLGEASRPL